MVKKLQKKALTLATAILMAGVVSVALFIGCSVTGNIEDTGDTEDTDDPPAAVVMYDNIAKHFTVNSGNQITIKWDAVLGATSYKVYYALVDSGAFVYIPANGEGKNGTADTTFTHTGLNQGTRYSYWITAENANGESDPYDGYIGYADTIVDHKPDPVKPKNDDEGAIAAWNGPMISLRWIPSPGATSYKVYYKKGTTSASLTYAFERSADTTTYLGGTSDGQTEYLDPFTTYHVYISAGNSHGWSNELEGYIGQATTGALPTPPAE
jgi:hypothetical protein